MKEIKFSELPDFIRVKLNEGGGRQLWQRVDEFGGVKDFCEEFDYSSSKMYNWRSKQSFLPVNLVRDVLGEEASDHVVALKGGGRSNPIENPDFPLCFGSELLTRVKCSVNVNSNGVPVYQTGDRGLVERFSELLNRNSIPFEVYNRSIYEVRYPKYVQDLLSTLEFETDFPALVDETGEITDEYVRARDRKVPLSEFEGELYSREKRYWLHLLRNDEGELQEIISEEVQRVSSL